MKISNTREVREGQLEEPEAAGGVGNERRQRGPDGEGGRHASTGKKITKCQPLLVLLG